MPALTTLSSRAGISYFCSNNNSLYANRTSCFGRSGHFDELAAFHIEDIAIDRDIVGHERMIPYTFDVFCDALRQIGEVQPLNEFAFAGAAGSIAGVFPS